MRLSGLIALFLGWVQQNRRPRTWEFYRDQLLPWVARVGDKLLEECHPMDLMMQGNRWHLWVAVQRLFNWATTKAKVTRENPFEEIEEPRQGQRKRVLSRAEQVRCLRGSAQDFRELLVAGRETAARPQEVRVFEWEWLQVEQAGQEYWAQVLSGHSFLLVDEYKGQSRRADDGPARIIPVSPRLGRLLVRLALRAEPRGVIFKSYAGVPWTKDAIVCRMRRLRARLMLPAKSKTDQVCYYTLRHTTATYWAAKGIPGRILQELLGHRDLRTTQRYLHIERYRQLEAIREVWKRRGRD